MWTESRYPNTAAPMARPLSWALAHRGEVSAPRTHTAHAAADRSILCVDMPSWLISGGKVTPVDGQEHPRTEL